MGAKLALFSLVIAGVVFARSASATELAILSNGFSIRHEHRLTMGTTTRLFLSADDSSFTDVPTAEITGFEKDLSIPVPPAPDPALPAVIANSRMAPVMGKPGQRYAKSKSEPAVPLSDVVNNASATYHLDPDLVNSVIHAESGFNAHAVSPKGARGLMQLMPRTATDLGVNDAFDAQDNVEGGSKYLRELLERYNFDLVKALAAYNAGTRRVEQYRGVPPFRETRAYVAKIVHEYNTKKIAQEKEAKRQQALASAATRAAKTAPASKTASAKTASTKIAAKTPQPN